MHGELSDQTDVHVFDSRELHEEISDQIDAQIVDSKLHGELLAGGSIIFVPEGLTIIVPEVLFKIFLPEVPSSSCRRSS